jgi:hypothetical protein
VDLHQSDACKLQHFARPAVCAASTVAAVDQPLLSLLLHGVQAGAKHVYGIECSSIADQAREIVSDNGFSSQVTIIQGKVEEVELPVQQVRRHAWHSFITDSGHTPVACTAAATA